jgi:hypothetical protein
MKQARAYLSSAMGLLWALARGFPPFSVVRLPAWGCGWSSSEEKRSGVSASIACTMLSAHAASAWRDAIVNQMRKNQIHAGCEGKWRLAGLKYLLQQPQMQRTILRASLCLCIISSTWLPALLMHIFLAPSVAIFAFPPARRICLIPGKRYAIMRRCTADSRMQFVALAG